MLNPKPEIIILGKLPPPYYGPAVATEIILNSKLKDDFSLIHVDTRLNSSINTMGKVQLKKIFLSLSIYLNYIKALYKTKVRLVLVPIAQKTTALTKDALFIILAKLHNKKVLLHLRGSSLFNWYENSNILVRYFFRFLFSRCDGGIVLGEKLRYIFEPFLTENKIFIIPNGANFTFPQGDSNKVTGISFLYFSNLIPSKGIEDILDAFTLLRNEVKTGICLEVVGNWGSRKFEEYCKNKVRQKQLQVIFHNSEAGKNKLKFYANADVFVFPPRAPEGHPWVIVEALAAELPIITTDQGAITESVIDGLNGFIVEPCNPEQIAEKIKILIKSPDLIKRMGKESRRLYEENFTEEKMVERLTLAFNSVLNQ